MNLFGRKKNDDDLVKATILKTKYDDNGALNEIIQIMANDGVNICAEACSCCWDTKIPNEYNDRAEYIAKRTRLGHSSVTEHSNHVYYMEIADTDNADLLEFLSVAHYVHTVYRHSKLYDKGYLIIGGSWRAFKDILIKIPSICDNKVASRFVSILYKTTNYAGFADIIKDNGIEDNFENANSHNELVFSKQDHTAVGDNIDIINIDDLDILISNIASICPEPKLFTIYDLLDMCTITVLFKNMSRVITQQLTRHRNAITQESQRYVDYSKGSFNSPDKFKEKYDPDYLYPIQFGKSAQKMTLQEIGDNIASIYGQLYDPIRTSNHELQREDARAFLPNNIKCNKIYITFTWRSFFSFLQLREEAHAQAEIRLYAQTLGSWFRSLYPEYEEFEDCSYGYIRNEGGLFFYEITKQDGYKTSSVIIDEVISEEEITEQMEAYAANSLEGEPYISK